MIGLTGIAVLLGLSTVALASCDGSPSMLDPRGPGAARIADLWWLLFWISAFVFAVVAGLLIAALARAKRRDDFGAEPRWGEPFIVVAGVVIPALVLGGVFFVSLRDMSASAQRGRDARVTIEVIAHNWWWEARYENGAVTANEIHVPVGEPVRLVMKSDDVIHSFWVPQLQAKTDLIPGRTNTMWLEADAPGRFRGQCAEFCGLQHSKMLFYVVAEPPDVFDAWLANEASDANAAPGTEAGEEVFLSSTCVGCHAVRGTEAVSPVGPDLTHLAARRTIAAGILPNTPGSLARFITDPQGVKPGAGMPPTDLTEDELDALLAYLRGLR